VIQDSPAGRCQLGFRVPDIDAFHKDVTGKGAHCVRAPKMEQFGKLGVYADPDGLQISVMEMPH
jgi:predicted enzyme related to lactoylglutathione lyase